MISKFIKEDKTFSTKDLFTLLNCSKDEEKGIRLIKKLREAGILKKENNSDIDNFNNSNSNIKYKFTYVGILILDGLVFKCYPKYISNMNNITNKFKQILKVLEKYNSNEHIIKMFNNNDENNSHDLLSIILFLLQDYFENGIYNNTEEIIQCNGDGEILWDKTINESFPIISNNKPYYIELKTRKKINNEFDYFKKLHECILTKVSNELKKAGLLDLFEITEVYLTDEILDDFGDEEYILYKLNNELNTQFNTRKQLVLKAMLAYINQKENFYDINHLSLFGTKSFYVVWEKVCAEIMNNQLHTTLGNLELPTPLKENYKKSVELIELIEKPLWTFPNQTSNSTFRPDIITIQKINNKDYFIIFDAKYYNPCLEKELEPNRLPGIESIAKQYLYQLAYKEFIMVHNISFVKNCFLMPTDNINIEDKGEVKLDMLSKLQLEDIKIRFIPATTAYDLYLSNKKMDINSLKL